MVEDVRDTRSPQPLVLKPRNPEKAAARSLRSIVSGVIAARRYNDTSMYHSFPSSIRPPILATVLNKLLFGLFARTDGEAAMMIPQTTIHCTRALYDEAMKSWEALVRIVTSPTPFNYVHVMKTLVFMVVFAFPYVFVETLGAVVVPATMLICLGLYGVMQLSQELENPLGWDDNDIDLTGFQDMLAQELHAIYAFKYGEALQAAPTMTKAQNAFASGVLSLAALNKAGTGEGPSGGGGGADGGSGSTGGAPSILSRLAASRGGSCVGARAWVCVWYGQGGAAWSPGVYEERAEGPRPRAWDVGRA